MKVYVNGKYYEKDQAVVSVFDHGLLYGDGVFEGIRCYNGRIFKLSDHVKRLYSSARAVSIDINIEEIEMEELVRQTVLLNNKKDCYIRLIVTRGKGDLGIDPRSCESPGLIIIADDIKVFDKELYEQGISIGISSYRRVPSDVFDPRIKSLNYLNNVLAKIEASRAGYQEALMLNIHGEISECTGDNIFIVKEGVIYTPAVECGVLEGVTRSFVINELAPLLDMAVCEKVLKTYDILTADECFLTGTAVEIVPVVDVCGSKVKSGSVGQVTKKLIGRFRDLLLSSKEKVA